jgi:hypothetical protein
VAAFYQTTVYSFTNPAKPMLSKRVKKLAPEVELETCSKQEARIY